MASVRAEPTTVVLPCYNEAARLDASRIAAFAGGAHGVRLLLVDDGSTDATRAALDALVARCPNRVGVLALPTNQGKAAAVRAGVLAAIDSGAPLVGYWDADLATPLDEIPRMAEVFDARPTIVAVTGARVKLLGRKIERTGARHYLGRLFATAAALALAAPVYDTQCGAKLFRVTPLVRLAFAVPFRFRWAFDVELLARLAEAARRLGAPPLERLVAEVPLEQWTHMGGSKLGPLAMLRAGLELARVRRCARRDVASAMQSPRLDGETGAGAADAVVDRIRW